MFKFGTFFQCDGKIITIIIYVINEFPTVIPPSQYIVSCNVKVFKHWDSIFDIIALPSAYGNAERILIGINCSMDFGAVSITAVAYFFVFRPFCHWCCVDGPGLVQHCTNNSEYRTCFLHYRRIVISQRWKHIPSFLRFLYRHKIQILYL